MSKYIVREGKVKGQGRYMGKGCGSDWQDNVKAAHKMNDNTSGLKCALYFGGRVVKLVPKKAKKSPKVEINECGDLYVNGTYIATKAEGVNRSIPRPEELAVRLREAFGV